MQVKCKKILSNYRPERKNLGSKSEDLTIGSEYIVLCVYFYNDRVRYQIEGDVGDLIIFEADQFEVLSHYIPSNWEIIVEDDPTETNEGSYYMTLRPKKWNNAPYSFYEEIVDVSGPLENWRHYPDSEIPEVVKLYLQEKDIIYREEILYQKSIKD